MIANTGWARVATRRTTTHEREKSSTHGCLSSFLVRCKVPVRREGTMLDLLLLIGLIVVGTVALWLVAKALILGGGLLEQALEWFVYGQDERE